MIVLVATPLAAVAVPVPVTVPAPEALAKVTTVVLSPVTVLPAASWIVAVRTRVAPEVRLAVEPVSAIWAAAPWTTVKEPSVPVVSPVAVACMTTGPTSAPVIGLGRDACGGRGGAGAGDGAGAGGLGEVDDGGVVGGDGVAGGVLDRRGQDARRAGGEVGGRAGERDLSGRAVDDREGAEGAGGEPGGGGLHRDRADERAGDRLGRDAAGGGRGARAGHRARSGLLGEGDDRGVVGGDGVAGGVLDRGGQDAGGAGGRGWWSRR